MQASRRIEVYYSGQVQGVGFRYTAAQLARSRPLSGYVRNLSDGRVELVVEGPPEDVQQYLKDLAREMEGHIDDRQIEERPATGEFATFDIRL